MYTEGKTLHVPVDNGLVPRLCFDMNPTPWTARLLQYAICKAVVRMRYAMWIHYGPRAWMRYANTLWAAWMRYANRLRAMSNCKVAFSATILSGPTHGSAIEHHHSLGVDWDQLSC